MSVGVLKLSGFEISGLRNTIDLSAVMGRGDSQVSSTPLDPMALRFALDQLRRRQGGLGNEARAGLGGVLFGRSPAQRQGIVCAPFEGSYKDFLGSLWNNQVASLTMEGFLLWEIFD